MIKKCMWFIIAIAISFLPGIFGVFFTPHGNSNIWYNGLIKSGLTPPGWVFSIAWTILYILLGIALYLVIRHKTRANSDKIRAYILFAAQLILNGLWSYMFFGAHLPSFALVNLLLLFVVSVWMARVFNTIDRRAAYLVIPYILWMMFAFYMNAYIVLMN
ncbi:MAG: tryptophan-rich sensory protein [Alphaproteobacteria bacterium]|nr:tryptophan-rich sensory protein [Alphaproteobacteria bacterium]